TEWEHAVIAALRAARLGWHGIDRRIAAHASRGGGFTVFAHELFWFGAKQAWACLFGALMLALLIATCLFWPADAPLGRYDFVTLMAIAIQIVLLASGLETRREALVSVLFHGTGTLMELFKTATGSCIYPGPSILHIGGVPLFTGFMYASVGSYIARAWRLFEFRFTRHPRWSHTALLAAAIYLNFFAENLGTFTRVWMYPSQHRVWHVVPPEKIGSWLLLMVISYVMVSALYRRALPDAEGGQRG